MLGVLMSEPWNPTSFHPRSSATMYTMLGLAPAAGAVEEPAGCASAGALATQIPDAANDPCCFLSHLSSCLIFRCPFRPQAAVICADRKGRLIPRAKSPVRD